MKTDKRSLQSETAFSRYITFKFGAFCVYLRMCLVTINTASWYKWHGCLIISIFDEEIPIAEVYNTPFLTKHLQTNLTKAE